MFDKRLLMTGVSLALVVCASALAAILPDRGNTQTLPAEESLTQHPPVRRTTPPQPARPERDYLYLIREFEGRIAVFGQDPDQPEMVLDTLIRHLPAYDQAQLQEGIRVYTREELAARIEDYTS